MPDYDVLTYRTLNTDERHRVGQYVPQYGEGLFVVATGPPIYEGPEGRSCSQQTETQCRNYRSLWRERNRGSPSPARPLSACPGRWAVDGLARNWRAPRAITIKALYCHRPGTPMPTMGDEETAAGRY
jgi:hypothetical protein